MALWVFGDSYCIESQIPREEDFLWDYDYNWIDYISQGLGVGDVRVVSQHGVSNDWIFKHFIDSTSDFQSGDYIVVQLTSNRRKWFFPEDPYLSNISNSFGYDHPKPVRQAIDGYIQYLQNDQLDNIQYTAYTYASMLVAQTRPDLKILLLPGFHPVPNVIGNLTTNVCNYELDDPSLFLEKHKGFDPRLNHMSHENHKILANKIIDFFNNGTLIDLTTGFIGNLYK